MKKHRVTPASAFGKAARELQVKETRTSASPVNRLMPHFLATFAGAQPCVTGVGVAALAAPNLQVEMELVVRLPD